ncbi:hypothetical protein FOZ63_009165, partial [Perkinsus olseni]
KSPPKASSSTKQKKGRPVQAAAYIVADWVIPYRHKFALALKVWWELLPRALAHIREKEPNVMAVYTLVHNNRPDYEIERYVKLNFIHEFPASDTYGTIMSSWPRVMGADKSNASLSPYRASVTEERGTRLN